MHQDAKAIFKKGRHDRISRTFIRSSNCFGLHRPRDALDRKEKTIELRDASQYLGTLRANYEICLFTYGPGSHGTYSCE